MKSILAIICCIFLAGCFATFTGEVQRPVEPTKVQLEVKAVDPVQITEKDIMAEDRALGIERDRLAFEREKWEYEKKEKELVKLRARLSSMLDIERDPPVFNMYSYISISDWQALGKDLETLHQLGYNTVIMNTFSGGGSAFAGMGIADVILYWRGQGMEIIGRASGLIASATVPIFAACSKRIAGPSTLFMVHEASLFKWLTSETHKDIKAQDAMLTKLTQRYCKMLESRSSRSERDWEAMINETTWFDAEEAMAWGLVDVIE